MYDRALTTYYFLSTVVLAAGFFVIQPTQIPEMKSFQNDIKQQVSVAWQQTIGDGPWFADVQFVYDGVENFYHQAADTTIAMMADRESDADIVYVFGTMYHDIAEAFHQPATPHVAGVATTVSEPEPPADVISIPPAPDTTFATPVNTYDMPWVTLRDNFTGQLYCVAIYNGTVNQYLGPCKTGYQ